MANPVVRDSPPSSANLLNSSSSAQALNHGAREVAPKHVASSTKSTVPLAPCALKIWDRTKRTALTKREH
jgi:hypothetical protein